MENEIRKKNKTNNSVKINLITLLPNFKEDNGLLLLPRVRPVCSKGTSPSVPVRNQKDIILLFDRCHVECSSTAAVAT